MMSAYDEAANLAVFKQTLRKLSINRLYSDIGVDERLEIDEADIEQAAWLASVLANSQEDDHRQRALSFTVLAYLWAIENDREELYEEYVHIVLSRLGNIPVAEQYLDSKSSFLSGSQGQEGDTRFGTASAQETRLRAARDHYRISNQARDTLQERTQRTEWDADELILTRFQSTVWRHLTESQYVAFSGPTSSGKSYLLREYVEREINRQEEFVCVYIVPTRALIAEVASSFSETASDETTVQTSVPTSVVEGAQVFVLTPERCLSLLDVQEELDVDLIFIDEVQNLEDGSRGVLFEYVYELLISLWPASQVVAAGPFIDNIQEPLKDIRRLGLGESTEESSMETHSVETTQTDYSPVYRLRTSMTLYSGEDEIELRLKDQIQESESRIITRPKGFSYTTVGNSYDTAAAFIEKFQQTDEPILVYARTPRRARDIAQRIAKTRDRPVETDFSDLIEFLQSSIHAAYPLIETLQEGVGYHHGGVPQVARGTVESLFREGQIDILVSTSTLLEGVNLPAAKILVVDHKRTQEEELSPFELQNLIGRVGRVGSRLHGQVFYVDREGDEWAAEKVEQTADKQIVPVTSRILAEQFEPLLDTIRSDPAKVEYGELRATSVILKSRYAIDREATESFLRTKQLDANRTEILLSELAEIEETLPIPPKLIEQNPTIDPEIQNRFYNHINNRPNQWVTNQEQIGDDMRNLIKNIDRVANIHSPRRFGDDNTEIRTTNFDDLVALAKNWIAGTDYAYIVNQQREIDPDDGKSVSKVIRNLRTDVRYVLVKYFKLIADIIEHLDPEQLNESDRSFTRSLDTYTERGSFDRQELALMNMGVARSVAINLNLPDDTDDTRRLRQLVNDYPPAGFMRTHLESQGIIKRNE